MFPNNEVCDSLEDYRKYEINLHSELMNTCREYLNKLSIVSIVGILEIVKLETIELEQATKKDISVEKSDFND